MIEKIRRADWNNTGWADTVFSVDGALAPFIGGFSVPISISLIACGVWLWGFILLPLVVLYCFLSFCNSTSVTNRLSTYEYVDSYTDENGNYVGRGENCKWLLTNYYNFNAEQRALLGGETFVDSMLTKMSNEKRAKVNYLATKAVKEIKKEAKLRKQAELNAVPTDVLEDTLTRAYEHAKIGNDTIRELM